LAKWFDRYPGPDLVVHGAAQTQRVLEARLGIPAGQPMRRTAHGSGFDIAYLQMNSDLSLSASWIQLMGLQPLTDGESRSETSRELRAMLLAYITAQRLDRPLVTHVQALSAPTEDDISAIVEMLRSRGVPHFARLRNVYIGLLEENGRIRYEPSADAGMFLEFAPTIQAGFKNFLLPPLLAARPEVAVLPPGTLVRPVARTQVVASAEAVIERFRAMLDWPDEDDLEWADGHGQRSVIIKPQNRLSAVWEIVEPAGAASRAGRVLARWGAGPWANRIGVFGLDAKLGDLERRGTRWTDIAPGPHGERRVALNRHDLRGVTIELEDMAVVYRGEGAGQVA
jgi:hypothetical protein